MTMEESKGIYQLFLERTGRASTVLMSKRDTAEGLATFEDVLLAQSAVDVEATPTARCKVPTSHYALAADERPTSGVRRSGAHVTVARILDPDLVAALKRLRRGRVARTFPARNSTQRHYVLRASAPARAQRPDHAAGRCSRRAACVAR
jgi:hypothetical protein